MTGICPRCHSHLTTEVLRGIEVDRCPNCKGVFFDTGELANFSRMIEIMNRIEFDEAEVIAAQRDMPRPVCPKDATKMDTHAVGQISIDRCPSCKGYWLDGGELAGLLQLETHIRENLNLYIRLGS